MKLVTETL